MAMFSWSTAKHSCKKLVGCNARLMTSNGKGNLMSDTLKAAARAGDPKALEALMNKSLGSRGITVRVTNSGSLLRVLLRGTEAPDRALLPLIQKGLGSIKPAGFEKVVVSARAIGKGDVWTETWQLAPGNAAAKSLSANNTKTPKPVVKTLLSSQQTTQWYQKTWLVVTMLVLFPFAGVPLAWLAQWSKPAKIVSSSIGSLWILILLFNGGTDVETASEPVPVAPPRETVAPTQQVVETDAPIPLKPAPIYPSRQPTELEVFQHTMEVKTPGVLASGEIESLNLSLLEQRCPSLVAASSDAGINTAISMLSSELRLNNGYDEKLATNLATGLIEGCAAWVRGDRISPGEIVDSSKPPTNQSAIDRWEQEYGDK